jgi:hypothetical protein
VLRAAIWVPRSPPGHLEGPGMLQTLIGAVAEGSVIGPLLV